MYQKRHNAAFINAIGEEGTRAEAIEWLQRTWDECCDLRKQLRDLGFEPVKVKEQSS